MRVFISGSFSIHLTIAGLLNMVRYIGVPLYHYTEFD